MHGPIQEVALANGLRALLVEHRSLPIVASSIWYRVESQDERTGETGLSHFLEHMMFKGTERYAKGEIDALTAKLGGSNNAFTSSDHTAYYFALASDRWETTLEIEANRMTSCLFDEAEFEAEKSVVLEELAMGEDDPWRSLWQAAETLMYQVHPYHHPVIGWREDLERVDAGAMRRYYERNYGPGRAFLVCVGDFDAGHAEQRIGELFGDIPARAEPRAPVLAEPEPSGERRAVVHFPGSIARFAAGVLTCRVGERDDFVLDVISSILASGRSSRLYRRLVLDEELVTTVSTINETRSQPGGFWLVAEVREGVDIALVEKVLREEVELLMDRSVTKAELRRARTQIRSSFLFEEETAMDIALRIGRFEADAIGGYKLIDGVLEHYETVTAKEVKEVARRYFGRNRWATVWSLPETKKGKR